MSPPDTTTQTPSTAIPPSPALPPPFLPTPSIPNLRDAGNNLPCGTTNTATTVIRPLALLRSADPSRASPADRAILRGLRVTKVFDLRSRPEIEKAGEGGGKAEGEVMGGGGGGEEDGEMFLKRVWVPVFEDEVFVPERLAVRYREYASRGLEGFVAAYGEILAGGGPAFGTILRHIANESLAEKPNALLVHCSAGKDRTGVFVAVLLSMLGVEDELIADEYALTEVGLAHVKPLLVKKISENPAFKETGAGKEGAERMSGAKKDSMLRTLVMIREKYGSAEGYVRTVCGLSTEEIERIRQVMVVPKTEGHDGDAKSAAV
ncbi:tyrosine phosphatase [Diplodia corticola]|uniref:Tyrosine phosphatase n=1 Tax=Diplodia corticola TaxID=236234 RepID=A0A1J9RRA8_9PEZI|nr:tyrosine phosphatase [Diplodia corticola]OJD35067.1 tyrosine phosphatase [Diplodia corticola]